MASRRMFSLSIVDSDAFLDMPPTARLLYYDLGMRADDDGFLRDAKRIKRITGAADDDMRVLAENGFIYIFSTGIIVIRHWKQNNRVKKDRYIPTVCINEFSWLEELQTKEYAIKEEHGDKLDTYWNKIGSIPVPKCPQIGSIPAPKCPQSGSAGKDSLVQSSKEKGRVDSNATAANSNLQSTDESEKLLVLKEIFDRMPDTSKLDGLTKEEKSERLKAYAEWNKERSDFEKANPEFYRAHVRKRQRESP